MSHNFFQTLLGTELGNVILPTRIEKDLFDVVLKHSTHDETDQLKKHYLLCGSNYELQEKYR